ncbi:hypothetical protein WN944_026231 [Citrus x changshan-huyou]|uniref:Uncharacterized protein n=1 Tax=Citrus x changshan-huyou TaxID=2935761 RepID=A0AAP0QHF3_9ROSI
MAPKTTRTYRSNAALSSVVIWDTGEEYSSFLKFSTQLALILLKRGQYDAVEAPRSRSVTTTPVRSRSVTTTLVRSRTVTNDLPGYDSGSICT